MAITKMMNIKQSKQGSGSAHLYNAINYILNENKTENGMWVGGNTGSTVSEIFDAMIDTKSLWEKFEGRQGYHFVISFRPGEVDEQTAYNVLQDFCNEYLQDDYDYVFAIHNDQEHMHGHIIFNSVNRITGYKYRYVDGDWEKYIQPITDSICKKYGIEPLSYEKDNKKGKAYGQWEAERKGKPVWKKVIRADIDYALGNSKTEQDFINKMQEFGYQVRTGNSKKYGKYFSFIAPGQSRAWRSYKLGDGYGYEDMMDRLGKEIEIYPVSKTPYLLKANLKGSYCLTNKFLKVRVRKVYILSYGRFRLVPMDTLKQGEIRKSVLHIDKMRRQIRYLYKFGINNVVALEKREEDLYILEKQLKNIIESYNNLQEDPKFLEYKNLKAQIKYAKEDEFENILDRLDILSEELPVIEDVPAKLKAVREEKKIIKGIKKDIPVSMSWRNNVPVVGTKTEKEIRREQRIL